MSLVEIAQGPSPVVLAFPQTGMQAPPDILARSNDDGCRLRATPTEKDASCAS